MDCKHRTGFTYRLSRLKPRTVDRGGPGGTFGTGPGIFRGSVILIMPRVKIGSLYKIERVGLPVP